MLVKYVITGPSSAFNYPIQCRNLILCWGAFQFDFQNFFTPLSDFSSFRIINIYLNSLSQEILNFIQERNRLRKLFQRTRLLAYKPELIRLKSEISDKINFFRASSWVTAI